MKTLGYFLFLDSFSTQRGNKNLAFNHYYLLVGRTLRYQ